MAKPAVKFETARRKKRQTGPEKPTEYLILAKLLRVKSSFTARPKSKWDNSTSIQLQFVCTGGNVKDFGFQTLCLDDSRNRQGDKVHLLRQCTVCNDNCYCKVLKWCPPHTAIGNSFVEIGQIQCSEGFRPLAGTKQLILDGSKEGEKVVKMESAEVDMIVRVGRKDHHFKGFEVRIIEK